MSRFNLDKVTEHLSRIPESFEDKVAQIGWFEGAVYPDGTPVAYVATIQENGSPAQGIPPRPTMRPTVEEHSAEWRKIMRDGVKAVSDGVVSADAVLDGVGAQAAGDVKKTISNLTTPPLSPATIAARASRTKSGEITASLEKPLVDSGLMLASVSHAVGKGE